MEHKLSTKGMILDICSMRSRAKHLLDKNPEYAVLLVALTSEDYYNDEDLSIPTIKELSEQTGISYSVVRRQLDKIYSDICSYEFQEDHPFKFENSRIRFGLSGLYNNITLIADGLKNLPRKGETIRIPFFKEFTGTDYYFVEKVYHEFEDNRHDIYISLKYGTYNSYWDLRKDQALETREIPMFDATMKSDYDLKKFLDLKPGNAW